jgi:hypothetical protein
MKLGAIRHAIAAAIVAALAAASGCAYAPLDGDKVPASNQIEWIGFATAPNVVILIQAQQPWDGTWVTIDSTRSSNTDWNSEGNAKPVFDPKLYQWSKNPVTIPGWAFNGSGQVALRSLQGDNTQYPMWMFDSAGFQCLTQRFWSAYNSNTTLDTKDAAQTCSRSSNGGQDRNQVTLHR